MQIGVFDSGLGGLAIANAIMARLPEYDFLYLGDTKRVPYGVRSQATIHEFVGQALRFLFDEDCQLVILACNTASAESLRKTQQEYLPHNYPDRRVLGVIIPTAEAAFESGPVSKVGVLATPSTVESDAFGRELRRISPSCEPIQQAAPLLVPLIENDGLKYIGPVLDDYLAPLQSAESILLACTHYCLVKEMVRERVSVPVISEDEIIPAKTADYLARHPEIDTKLAKNGRRRYCVTDVTESYRKLAWALTGEDLPLEVVNLE